MTEADINELYTRHIKPLPLADRLRLLSVMAQELARAPKNDDAGAKRSIMELHGLGRDIWQGRDAQEYVNELRQEWDQRL
jgi:hypothetical protein